MEVCSTVEIPAGARGMLCRVVPYSPITQTIDPEDREFQTLRSTSRQERLGAHLA